jgi:hypothetical protein
MPQKSYHLRLPRTLHEQLVAQAEQEGVSLNLLLSTLLAAAIDFNLRPANDEPVAPDDEQPLPNAGDEQPGADLPAHLDAAVSEATA